MEKISGIVPASTRVTAVDLRESASIRPGTPAFGRPESVSPLKDNAMFAGTAPKSAAVQKELLDWKAKDSAKASIVAKMNDSFFIKKERGMQADRIAKEPGIGEAPSATANSFVRNTQSTLSGFKTDQVGSLRAASNALMSSAASEDYGSDVNDEPMMQQPDGLFPKGSFIDRTA